MLLVCSVEKIQQVVQVAFYKLAKLFSLISNQLSRFRENTVGTRGQKERGRSKIKTDSANFTVKAKTKDSQYFPGKKTQNLKQKRWRKSHDIVRFYCHYRNWSLFLRETKEGPEGGVM